MFADPLCMCCLQAEGLPEEAKRLHGAASTWATRLSRALGRMPLTERESLWVQVCARLHGDASLSAL